MLKHGRFGLLLHGVPVHTVCRLHDRVRRVWLVVVSSVVPCTVPITAAGFHDAITNSAQGRAFRCSGESCGDLLRFGRRTGKAGCIIERITALATGHLIPCTSIGGRNNGVRRSRFLILSRIEQFNLAGFTIRAGCRCADMPSADLRTFQRLTCELRHIVAETAVSNIPGNAAGSFGGTSSNRRYRLACKRRAVSGGHTAKDSAYKSNAAAHTHARTAFNNSVSNIAVALEFAGESGSKTAGSRTCTSGS